MEKWHQQESMSGFSRKSETAKKITFLLPDYAFINFGLISPIFGQILKCNIDKVASAGIYVRICQISRKQQKRLHFTI